VRPLIDIAYRVRRRLMTLLRWQTRGVKIMAFDPAGRVLLVRHRYGRSDLWMLPGGGIARGESAHAAAARELAEETACEARDIAFVGTFVAREEGRRDVVQLFRGVTSDTPVADAIEIAEARFVPLDALPADVSAATLRRIAEHLGERIVDGRW